jgi:hypothetical protein
MASASHARRCGFPPHCRIAIVKDVMAIARVGDDAVSIAIEEVEPGDWADKVYKPDIINGRGEIYKKPGYKIPE